METQKLEPNSSLIHFITLNGCPLFGIYHPGKTTIGQIRKSFFDNYSCSSINEKNIVFYENNLILDDLEQNKTMNEISESVNIRKIHLVIRDPEQPWMNTRPHIDNFSSVPVKMSQEYRDKLSNSKEYINVRTLTGKVMTLPILADTTVGNLKELIEIKERIPFSEGGLIFAGKRLENDKLLMDYGVMNSCEMHLVIRLRGGMFSETSGRAGNFERLKRCYFKIEPNL